ncbi:MAG: dTDP-4-dehydrorhamnose 3,5-epimerase family protein [Planctomycetota bacterium]
MIFDALTLAGAYLVKPERIVDDRGHFARAFCECEFGEAGLESRFVQSSMAFTREAGTVRGLHFQTYPHWETKFVRCTRGRAWVVIVDLRREERTFCNWIGVELTEENGHAIYVPEGFAQGYQTLSDDTEVLYQMNREYVPKAAAGYSYCDPAFSINWPIEPRNLSAKDLSWSPFE